MHAMCASLGHLDSMMKIRNFWDIAGSNSNLHLVNFRFLDVIFIFFPASTNPSEWLLLQGMRGLREQLVSSDILCNSYLLDMIYSIFLWSIINIIEDLCKVSLYDSQESLYTLHYGSQ